MSRTLSGLLVILAIVAADQVVKQAVTARMAYHEMIDILPFLALFHTHNEGIAFSFLTGLGDAPLLALTVAVLGFVLWLWRGNPADRRLSHIGFAMIIGGAVGNMIDRATLGYVIDYVLFHTPAWSFAVFNLADAAITVGAGAVLLDEVLSLRHERKKGSG